MNIMAPSNFGPFIAIFGIISFLIPLAGLVLAIYVVVCIHQIRKATQQTVDELREIRTYLMNRDKRE